LRNEILSFVTRFLILLFALGGVGTKAKLQYNAGTQACSESSARDAKMVPLIRLISNPEPYVGQCIAVNGYISFNFEDKHIYLTMDAYKNRDIDLAAAINLPDMENSNLYAADYYKDHEGVLIGTIENYIGLRQDKTIIHLYKTRFQILEIPITQNLINRGN